MPEPAERVERRLPREWVTPAITPQNRPFFTTPALRIQRCRDCGTVQHPPLELCHACRGMDLGHVTARPAGVVEAVTVVHHPVHDLLAPAVPYTVAVVSLEDHPAVRIVGNVIDEPPGGIRIGDRVACCWAAVPADGENVWLAHWRPAGSPAVG